MKKKPSNRTGISEFFLQFRKITYKKGETILRAQDSPRGVYFIKRGGVILSIAFPDGRDLYLSYYSKGDYFPLSWALADIENQYTYKAFTNTVVYRAPRQAVVDFLAESKNDLINLASQVLLDKEKLMTAMGYLMTGSSHNRMVSVLYIFAKRYGEDLGGNRIRIGIPLTHQDIANFSGLSRETISVALKELLNNNDIERKGRYYYIKNIHKFEEILYDKESLVGHLKSYGASYAVSAQ